ncbi:uncharacterized protein PRCAT00004136001 [Priceomyces carsonii]|uniref:uncharacterized protein n=1 Tax=Priceomyces carsonii TaxID=28549 RepID=UPI002ED8BD26|nr:unnamed protein product [Priceomyces carsonii]
MFGAVCSGRPMQIAEQVDTTKYVISIPNAGNISHIAIFLLPNSGFVDPNYTALVFFQLPSSQEFKLLGGLNPLKPSAIFKLKNNATSTMHLGQVDDIDMNVDEGSGGAVGADVTINIGISIETTVVAEQQLAEEKQKKGGQSLALVPGMKPSVQPKAPNDIAALANKIVGHAYNYLGSFIDASGKVPMKAFDNWWEKFKAKLANNPNFLDELQN